MVRKNEGSLKIEIYFLLGLINTALSLSFIQLFVYLRLPDVWFVPILLHMFFVSYLFGKAFKLADYR